MSSQTDAISGHNTEPVPGCMVCEQAFSPDRKVVLDSEQFRAYATEIYPWCVMVVTKRHDCDGPWSLNEAEAADLGRIVTRLSKAIQAMGNERVYVLSFGEDILVPHFHLGVFSRWQPISEATHEVLYTRAKAEADAVETAGDFAREIREHLV